MRHTMPHAPLPPRPDSGPRRGVGLCLWVRSPNPGTMEVGLTRLSAAGLPAGTDSEKNDGSSLRNQSVSV
jgi:hypothetical protein